MSKKRTLIKGTLILIIAGVLTRIIGFFFRIFLIRIIGADGIGIYQLIFPVQFFLCSLCSLGIQTIISYLTASEQQDSKSYLWNGMFLSIVLSIIASFLLYNNASFVSVSILREAKCVKPLKYISYSIPFASIHNCICGYYYGKNKAGIPGASQLIEQLGRVLTTYTLYIIFTNNYGNFTVADAILGALGGEIFAALFCLFSLNILNVSNINIITVKKIALLSTPLTINKVLLSLFQSAEAILLPSMLKLYGYSSDKSLSIYGILTGMALPIIMFPSTVTISLSTLLLPTISKCDAENNTKDIKKAAEGSAALSIYLGILCTGVFFCYGKPIGSILLKNSTSGYYLVTLSLLCPFLYLNNTLSSILHGLQHTTVTLIFNIISISVRIAFSVILVPTLGISAYLVGVLVSSSLLTLLQLSQIKKYINFKIHIFKNIFLPIVFILISIIASDFVCNFLVAENIVLLIFKGAISCFMYCLLIYKFALN